jgi:GT2 family glycosyltransferase
VSEQPTVSVAIPVYNRVDLLERCLISLGKQDLPGVEVIVVDDQSPEDPGPVMARFPDAVFIRFPKNRGYTEATNEALRAGKGRYLLLLNSDTELPPDSLSRMVAFLEENSDAGVVTPVHRGTDGKVQRTCCRLPRLGTSFLWDSALHRMAPGLKVFRWHSMLDWDHVSERWVEFAMTSCLLIRREIYDRIGGLDPLMPMHYNDTDYCKRIGEAGYKIRFLGDVEILHHGGASLMTLDWSEARSYRDRYRYYRKWFGFGGVMAFVGSVWSRTFYETVSALLRGRVGAAVGHVKRWAVLNTMMVAPERLLGRWTRKTGSAASPEA